MIRIIDPVNFNNLPVFESNEEAIAGGVPIGKPYKTVLGHLMIAFQVDPYANYNVIDTLSIESGGQIYIQVDPTKDAIFIDPDGVVTNSVAGIINFIYSGVNSGLCKIYINKESHSLSMYGLSEDSMQEWISAFTGDLIIPDSITSIGNHSFSNLPGLTSVLIPNSVTSIEDYAFYLCRGLTSVSIPHSVTSIGISAFDNCNGLTSLIIPHSVTSIRDCTFNGCSGLTSFIIPDSVTSIGNYAFNYCFGLTSVLIPDSVTSIGANAFFGCSGLTSLSIPDSVTSIGASAFNNCNGLTYYNCYPMVAPVLGDYVFDPMAIPLHIKADATGYDVAPWNDPAIFSNIITDL